MTTPAAARRRPPGRYDPPSLLGARVTAVVLSVLFIALLVAVAATVYSRYFTQQVRADVLTFEVVSDDLVRIELRVLKPAGSEAYCYIRARAPDGSEVGREVVVVDDVGTDEEIVRLETELTTRGRATTGEVGRCRDTPLPPAGSAP